jgi:beta-lactamase class A
VLTADEAATTGVAVMLPDGSWLGGLNPDLPGYAASTFKLAVLYEAERQVSEGLLSYDNGITIDDEARAEDLGTLDRLPIAADGTVSLGAALEAMVSFSDNASAVALLRLLGPSQVDARLRELGIVTMSVNDRALPATARDLATLMAAIVRGEGLSDEAQQHALGLLFTQEVRAGIPAALESLPGVVRVGNKTGTWENATRDVAVVESSWGTYVVAVVADGDWNWELIGRVARAVHEELTRG